VSGVDPLARARGQVSIRDGYRAGGGRASLRPDAMRDGSASALGGENDAPAMGDVDRAVKEARQPDTCRLRLVGAAVT
jgi:hypothetical protein